MMNATLVGLDLAKNVFEVLGVNARGEAVFSRRLKRSEMNTFFANLPPCQVAMEACGGSFHWARRLASFGHDPLILPAQYVTPFRKACKNDRNDARAICEAAVRPDMRRVAIKSLAQQDVELEHHYRRRLVGARTRLAAEVRSLLLEYGIALPLSVRALERGLAAAIEEPENGLSEAARRVFERYAADLRELSEKLKETTRELELRFRSSEVGQRIHEVPGIGPISGSALAAIEQQAKQFKNGRQFAAWLGLVPQQYSSGDRQVLGRIHKRGNAYLRTLLVHGSRAVLSKAKPRWHQQQQQQASTMTTTDAASPPNSPGHLGAAVDPRIEWALRVEQRRGMNKASVALANKNARVVWHLLTHPDARYRGAAPRALASGPIEAQAVG